MIFHYGTFLGKKEREREKKEEEKKRKKTYLPGLMWGLTDIIYEKVLL